MILSQARKQLYKSIREARDPYDPVVLETINLILERIYTFGKWKRSYVEVSLNQYNGEVTLPRYCQSMLFYRQNRFPCMIKNQWFEWQRWGVGYRDGENCNLIESYDKGAGFCSFRDFSSPRQLRIKSLEAEDADISVTLQGIDDNDQRIYTTDPYARHPVNGEGVTLAAGIGDTDFTFKTFTGSIKPVTRGYIEVWTINPDDNSDETMIGVYDPGEEVPDYRRYKVGNVDQTNITLYGLCKLKFVPLQSETDIVIPDNIGALKQAIAALQFEDAVDTDGNSDKYWAKCFSILNSELAQERGGAQAIPQLNMGAQGQRKILNIY